MIRATMTSSPRSNPRFPGGLVPLALMFAVALSTGALAHAQSDVIKLQQGNPLRARVWDRTGDSVTFNTFFTGIRKVTFGTEKLPAKGVKEIVDDPDPHRAFWRRAAALSAGTADEWVKLGADAEHSKLRGLARHAYTEALVRDRANAAALKALDSKAKEILASDPRLDDALRAKLAAYLALEDPGGRDAAFREIQQLGCTLPQTYLDRAWRSSRRKPGRTDENLLTLRSQEHKGTYCLFVPQSYDPLRPTPLVVGLHGGGRGGKDGKAVVGSGESAMAFYRSGAERLGWIVVCPTAIAAPWSEQVNDGFLLTVVDEICALYNVDRNRIYLTGHSMGGYGTWHYGPLYAHLWAAIAPMAGGGRPDLKRLTDTLTGVYIYHGADDPVVGVGSDREVAQAMKKAGMDFAYAEIPDSGHGFPPEVESEMWEFFIPRRLAVTPDRSPKGKFTTTQEPESSFLTKPTADELKAFGPLGKPAAADGDAREVTTLLADLRAGGGLAEKAAARLATFKDAVTAERIVKVVIDPASAPDTKRFAAVALGTMGQPSAIKPLAKLLADDSLSVVSAAAIALGQIGGADSAKALTKGLEALKIRFEKKVSGQRIDFSDFEAHLATAAAFADGVKLAKDGAPAAALHATCSALLSDKIDVDFTARAGQNPATPRRALAKALIDACAALPGPAVKPTLDLLASRPDLGVAERAKELLPR